METFHSMLVLLQHVLHRLELTLQASDAPCCSLLPPQMPQPMLRGTALRCTELDHDRWKLFHSMLVLLQHVLHRLELTLQAFDAPCCSLLPPQ